MNDESTSAVDELDLDNNYHSLFPPGPTARPDFKPERFDRIRVFRVTSNGPKQIPYEFLPSQLRDAQSFVKLLGGGVFELWAIKLPSGQLYAKRTHDFDAPVRTAPIYPGAGSNGAPTTPDAPAHSPAAAFPGMPPMPPGTDPMMQFLFWQSIESRKEAEQRAREEREREERRRDREEARASEDRRAQMALVTAIIPALLGNKSDPAELLKGIAEYTKAMNPAPAHPQQSAMGVIKESLELNKMLDDRARDMKPEPAEESLSQTVTTILGAVAPLMANTPSSGGSSVGATPSVGESVARVVGAVA
jgi:hypothetical protein